MQNFDFKIEILQFNQQKEEKNTCELFQYQTDFIKQSGIFKTNDISIESNSFISFKNCLSVIFQEKQCGKH
jgi:hypothetical protein